jgi:hypothetical protein
MLHREPDGWRAWTEHAVRKGRASASAAPSSLARVAKQILKAIALAAAPLGLLPGVVGSRVWLLFLLVIAGWVSARRVEDRFALCFLWRTRDWPTLAAAPALLWLRRFGLAIGGVANGRAGQSGSGTR